jgi:hypothetical protein
MKQKEIPSASGSSPLLKGSPISETGCPLKVFYKLPLKISINFPQSPPLFNKEGNEG